jgi:hypothetical protein
MNWTELLTQGIHYNFAITERMMDLVEDSTLDWKPATGDNWMTTGQLLQHIDDACGKCFKGFVTGDWGMPDGMDISKMTPEEMLLTADQLPTVSSVAQARQQLAEDKQIALDMLARCSEEDLNTKKASAPWDPTEMLLGQRLLQMIDHLASHKSQLFYYLKLQGKSVDTSTLWDPA